MNGRFFPVLLNEDSHEHRRSFAPSTAIKAHSKSTDFRAVRHYASGSISSMKRNRACC